MKYIIPLSLFYFFIHVRHAKNCSSTDLCVQNVLCHLLTVDKQERDKRPRDKGPVIRDGVRPVPRLASRTITLRELESVQTGSDQEKKRERASELPLSLISSSLSSSFCPISSLCASYFVNRMITRLRSRAPRATCSRSAGVEGEYILSGEVPEKALHIT